MLVSAYSLEYTLSQARAHNSFPFSKYRTVVSLKMEVKAHGLFNLSIL